jgi:TPP-dependent pyruvate/acetoin dehydrogenase alpha subunit|tara:strand:- start:1677 stop:2519 length:843 start_codon:yes stop_codon:yes gene_type:complete
VINKKLKINIFKRASLCRHFEENVYKYVQKKIIKFPIYLSAGQEFIHATLSEIIRNILKIKPLIFAQHRCHSTYLSFGGSAEDLIKELLGKKDGCAYGMGGSASIHSPKIKMYGHDGHMGTQVPVGIGACFASKKPTIIFFGDAAAEEDYVIGALGWASTKKLPILFIIEDNNLSILTKKKIRRNWDMHMLARSFKMNGFNISDNPNEIIKYKTYFFKRPTLLNINTNRLYWHSGAGKDSDKIFDRYKFELKKMGIEGKNIDLKIKNKIDALWKKQLGKQ